MESIVDCEYQVSDTRWELKQIVLIGPTSCFAEEFALLVK